MNEEIEQTEKNKIWTLVPRPKDKNVIGTKWVFKNKLNEDGEVSRNKARLVCKGYSQEDGIRDSSVTGVQTCALPILM